MDRNVCRCGTYPRIVRAVKLAAERMRKTESAGLSAVAAAARRRRCGDESPRRYRDRSRAVRADRSGALPLRGRAPRVHAHLRRHGRRVAGVRVDAGLRAGVGPHRTTAASTDVSAWVHIDERGHITGYTGKTEIGQNIRTSLAQAIADELRVPLDRVSLVMADTDLVPFDQGTFGSQSTPRMAPQLARAAAAAREMLLDRAAAQWNVDRVHARRQGRTDRGAGAIGRLRRDHEGAEACRRGPCRRVALAVSRSGRCGEPLRRKSTASRS